MRNKYIILIILILGILSISLVIKNHNSRPHEIENHSDEHSDEKEDGHDEHSDEDKDEHDDHSDEAEHSDGISLSKEAIKTYGISLKTVKGRGSFILPRSAMVSVKDNYVIYKLEGKMFEELQPSIIKMNNKTVRIKHSDLKSGDKVVISGAPYLRIILLNSKNKSSGHSH